MSLLTGKSIFTTMLQDGPFATGEAVPLAEPFSTLSKNWVACLRNDPLVKTKYRAVRNQIFDFLAINSFAGIITLQHNQSLMDEASRRGRRLLANMFAINGTESEVDSHIYDYSRTADDVINSLRLKVLAPYGAHIEMTNEISIINDPVRLLLIIFDDRFHKKARFEAKRKLVLMNLAGSIDQRERETGIEHKFSDFLDFLNARVWSPNIKIGDLEINYLYSIHDKGDFSCREVKVLTEAEADQVVPVKGEKLTLIKRRRFRDGNLEIPVYVTMRKKPPAARVIKLLRKNEKNPATAVDDELGLMAVLNNISDVKRFLRHLTSSAIEGGSFMTLEDISDTLTGGKYSGCAVGSSGKTPMLKFFARLGGMRVEFIVHTNRSYLNYMYQREVAHDEYEVKRVFDTGVAEFLFPMDIYHLDMKKNHTF